jgi:putative DNA primase/helicase
VKHFSDLGIAVRAHGPTEQRVPCPQCDRGSRDDALGVNLETGAFHCFRCGWRGRAGSECDVPAAIARRIDDPTIAERKRERLRRIWKQCVPLSHADAAPVRAYLASRGLDPVLSEPPKVLRAHAGIEYWDSDGNGWRNLGRFPAMVALYHASDEQAVTLHVTFLRPDGMEKAGVPVPKKTLPVATRGATKGGAIRLYTPTSGVLGIAEGIESALSLHIIRGIPVWSARCADNLEHIRLPRGLRRLEIGVDVDENGKGRHVAEALAERVCRFSPATKTYLIMPEVDGPGDLNDELQRKRTHGGT